MPKSYSVADARACLPEILDQAEAGRDVRLTRRGRPVAVVVSADRYQTLRSDRTRFGEAYRAFLRRYSTGTLDLETAFFATLRARESGRRVGL
ncbi:MAG: type II toxin-antitoxin system Phd/YefM family antitoxin [Burkholderiales bacterium]